MKKIIISCLIIMQSSAYAGDSVYKATSEDINVFDAAIAKSLSKKQETKTNSTAGGGVMGKVKSEVQKIHNEASDGRNGFGEFASEQRKQNRAQGHASQSGAGETSVGHNSGGNPQNNGNAGNNGNSGNSSNHRKVK